MKATLVILLIFFSPGLLARFFVAPGLSLSPATDGQQETGTGKPYLGLRQGLGLELDLEALLGPFSLVLGGSLKGSSVRAQYVYVNPSNHLDSATVPDLNGNATTMLGFLGARLRFINFERFKVYGGGGVLQGTMTLTYDEARFEAHTGSRVGLMGKEEQSLHGQYWEAGIEYFSRDAGALRFGARQSKLQSDRFETLREEALTFKTLQLTIQYVHPFL